MLPPCFAPFPLCVRNHDGRAHAPWQKSESEYERIKTIWADAGHRAYRGQELADWCKAHGDWDLDVVERAAGVRGFAILPKRWIVERTFGRLSRPRGNRRMSKDYERTVQTSETLIEVAMIRLLLARQGRRD